VVGVIAPWNFPFELAVSESVTAMLAGCTVIVKPSEVTPLIALWAEELFKESGLPDNVLQIATGLGATGAALVGVVDRICFTGSTATGRKVAVACAERLIPCTLELGGKDPMIVCDDADIEKAAGAAVYGAFFNAGQMCTSIERAYVHEDVYDAFVRQVVDRTNSMRLTEDEGGPQDFGSMTFEPQIDLVDEHVQDAQRAVGS
jgi:acyl-CoA reductase-like NAD-dependent aldehyde dehydrogenase